MIYDNARYHTSHATEDKLKDLGIAVLTLPAYCPQFNPTEIMINLIKRKVESQTKFGR